MSLLIIIESIFSILHTGILLLHIPPENHTFVIPYFSDNITASFPISVKNTPHLTNIKNPSFSYKFCNLSTIFLKLIIYHFSFFISLFHIYIFFTFLKFLKAQKIYHDSGISR